MYGQTYADIEITPSAVAWQMLRSLRHAPPGKAARGDRKATFNAALEQAEQFFSAASVAGTATRPVLIFYGLAQAGWAITAAATNTDNNHWRLPGGHGIKTGPVHDSVAHDLANFTLQNAGRGSFTKLADVLNAASLPQPTQLGQLWCLLPEAHRFPLPGMGDAHPLVVSFQQELIDSHQGPITVQPLPDNLAHIPPAHDHITGQGPHWEEERTRVFDYLAEYPGLAGWTAFMPKGQPLGLQGTGAGQAVTLKLGQIDPTGSGTNEVMSHTISYRGRVRYAFPRVGGSDLPAHPFLLWWLVTFGLSQLARYEPKGWAERISVSSSADATPIEHLLDQALLVLPELIHRTILEVTEGG